MRIAITGANGYLGRHIVAALKKQHHTIIMLVRSPKKDDVAFELGKKIQAKSLKGIDILIHCAYDFSPRGWKDIKRVNADGSIGLLRAAKRAGARTIFISSIAAFPGCKSHYGRSKLVVEASGLCDVIIRPGLVYGGDDGSMLGKLKHVVKEHHTIPLISRLDKPVFLCHVDDLCALILRCAETPQRYRIPITAASDTPIEFRALLQSFSKKRLRFVRVPYGIALTGLKTLEALHLPLGFKSDSLVSLANANTKPDFRMTKRVGARFRKFK